MKVAFNTWRNDLTYAQNQYKENEKAELIKVELEEDTFSATLTLSVEATEKLINELSDHIRWIKEA